MSFEMTEEQQHILDDIEGMRDVLDANGYKSGPSMSALAVLLIDRLDKLINKLDGVEDSLENISGNVGDIAKEIKDGRRHA